MGRERIFDKVKKEMKELLNKDTRKTFFNGKENFDDIIDRKIRELSEKYKISFDELISILHSMQETETNVEEDFNDEE